MGIETSVKHMEMWDKKKNPKPPDGIGFYNQSKKYWWKCVCGKSWESYVISITRRQHIGCRECISKKYGFIDFAGRTIGQWKVIKKIKNRVKCGSLWLAECLGCNREYEVRGDNLRAGMTNKCHLCHAEDTRKNNPIASSHWTKIKSGALDRGINFDITVDEAYDLFLIQNGKCALTGKDMHLYSRRKMHEQVSPQIDQYASLDRIDSSKGYTIDNVQWVKKKINLLKMAFSQGEFIELCCEVADNHRKKMKEEPDAFGLYHDRVHNEIGNARVAKTVRNSK